MSLFNLSSKMFKKLPREVAAHIEAMQQHFGKQVNQLEEQNNALKKQNKELADENAYLEPVPKQLLIPNPFIFKLLQENPIN